MVDEQGMLSRVHSGEDFSTGTGPGEGTNPIPWGAETDEDDSKQVLEVGEEGCNTTLFGVRPFSSLRVTHRKSGSVPVGILLTTSYLYITCVSISYSQEKPK